MFIFYSIVLKAKRRFDPPFIAKQSVLDWQYATDSCKSAGVDLCPATQFDVNDPGGASQIRAFAQ